MTAGEFSQVDLDLLADYVGGALSGTPDEATVAARIGDDPAWADAYAALLPAVDAIRDQLAALATIDVAMPADIAARLDATVGSITADTEDKTGSAVVMPLRSSRRTGRRGATGARRWTRWAAPVSVAAALAAFAGFGISQITGSSHPASDSAATATEASEPFMADVGPDGLGSAAAPAADRVLASGTDYSAATLAPQLDSLVRFRSPISASPPAPAESLGILADGRQGADLSRLADPTALATCLDAVASAHNRGPITVDLIDYATYHGAPALVVAFIDQRGERWAWVAGPGCGTAESGADTRYQAQVG